MEVNVDADIERKSTPGSSSRTRQSDTGIQMIKILQKLIYKFIDISLTNMQSINIFFWEIDF